MTNPALILAWLVSCLVASSLICLVALVTLKLANRVRSKWRHDVLSLAIIGLIAVCLIGFKFTVTIPLSLPATTSVHAEVHGTVHQLTLQSRNPLWLSAIAFFLLTGWIAGALITIARLVVKLRLLPSHSPAIDNDATHLIRSRLTATDSSSLGQILHCVSVSQDVEIPCCIGLIRGHIYLPARAAQWSTRILTSVMTHESQHLQQRDAARSILACLAISLFWYNPLVRLLASKLFEVRELACDDEVIRMLDTDPIDYFDALLAASSPHSTTTVIASTGTFEQLRGRIERLSNSIPTGMHLPSLLSLTIAVFLTIAIAFSGLQFAPHSFNFEPTRTSASNMESQPGDNHLETYSFHSRR
ncbi:MAG: M56 family metallopeptidase [Pirellulaceae bacterium]